MSLNPLDKIRAIKEQVQKRKEEERLREEQEEQKKQEEIDSQYQSLSEKKEQFLQKIHDFKEKISEIHGTQGEMIEQYRKTIDEAKDDPDVLQYVRDHFDEVFSDFKKQWREIGVKKIEGIESKKELEEKVKETDLRLEELYSETTEGMEKLKEEMMAELEKVGVKPFKFDNEKDLTKMEIPYYRNLSPLFEKYGEEEVKEAILSTAGKEVRNFYDEKEKPLYNLQEELGAISPEAFENAKKKYEEFKEAQVEFKRVLSEKSDELKEKGEIKDDLDYVIGYRGEKYEDFIRFNRYESSDKDIENYIFSPNALPRQMDYRKLSELLKERINNVRELTEFFRKIQTEDDLLKFSKEKMSVTRLKDDELSPLVKARRMQTKAEIPFLDSRRIKYEIKNLFPELSLGASEKINYGEVKKLIDSRLSELEEQKQDALEMVKNRVEFALLRSDVAENLGVQDLGTLKYKKESFEQSKEEVNSALKELSSLESRFADVLDKPIIVNGNQIFIEDLYKEHKEEAKRIYDRKEAIAKELDKKERELSNESLKKPLLFKGTHEAKLKKLQEDVNSLKNELSILKQDEYENSNRYNEAYVDVNQFFEKLGDGGWLWKKKDEFFGQNRELFNESTTLRDVFDSMKKFIENNENGEFPKEKQEALEKMQKLSEQRDALLKKHKA